MFEKNDEEYLLRNLNRNNILLFLGAGFSSLASNLSNENLPLGMELSKKIWEFLGYTEEFDNSTLQDLYQALLASSKKKNEISEFLNRNLLVSSFPPIYDILAKPFWYRIYSLNIDNLIEEIYKKNTSIGLKSLSYPYDEPEDRDQSLDKIQLIHLNGKLPCEPQDIVFSTMQYAKSSIQVLPFYQQFVREYATRPTIFIGTELNEQLLWQHIESRKQKPSQLPELRPKSFLISRKISKPKQANLKEYNIVSVEASAEDFLLWLDTKRDLIVNKNEVLKVTLPSLSYFYETIDFSRFRKEFSDFTNSFNRVSTDIKPVTERSLYLLGAAPKWEDIINDFDAPRDITTKLYSEIIELYNKSKELSLNFILGSGGCGKSTILRRLGIRLVQNGCNVYLTNSEVLPEPENLFNVLKLLDQKVILLFDNAEIVLKKLQPYIDKLNELKHRPIFIVASRTNNFDRMKAAFNLQYNFKEFFVPNLNRDEIKRVIKVLDENKLLGKLQGLTNEQRIHEFESRANKQILVAMKEATSGLGFDMIIKDEFSEIQPDEAKILCLCVALATSLGYRITIQEFIGCSTSLPSETLIYLKRNLRDIVVESGNRNEELLLRHKVIAEYIVNYCVTLTQLRESFVRILNVLGTEVKSKGKRTKRFNLYKALINHKFIFNKFSKDIKEARKIYDSLSDLFKDDFLFWLQYGTLELIGGDLVLAENYINQSDSLKQGDNHVLSAKGYLYLKKSIVTTDYKESLNYLNLGSQIILSQLADFRSRDSYFYHIYCKQKYNWIIKWLAQKEEEKKYELYELRKISAQAVRDFPDDSKLSNIDHTINVTYLNMGIDISERPEDNYLFDEES